MSGGSSTHQEPSGSSKRSPTEQKPDAPRRRPSIRIVSRFWPRRRQVTATAELSGGVLHLSTSGGRDHDADAVSEVPVASGRTNRHVAVVHGKGPGHGIGGKPHNIWG